MSGTIKIKNSKQIGRLETKQKRMAKKLTKRQITMGKIPYIG